MADLYLRDLVEDAAFAEGFDCSAGDLQPRHVHSNRGYAVFYGVVEHLGVVPAASEEEDVDVFWKLVWCFGFPYLDGCFDVVGFEVVSRGGGSVGVAFDGGHAFAAAGGLYGDGSGAASDLDEVVVRLGVELVEEDAADLWFRGSCAGVVW